MIEIERKFLVVSEEWKVHPSVLVRQGYLSTDPDRTVRVRTCGNKAWLTIKGAVRGLSRQEYEYPVPIEEAEALLKLCHLPLIEKYRFRVLHGDMVWEIDEFIKENRGLVIAEIELKSERQKFARPEWLGAEVTHDTRFYNSNLMLRPFSTWARGEKPLG